MAIRNWAGSVTFSTDALETPTSLAALQALVATSRRLRVLGTGHSFSPVADTDGVLVSLAQMPGTCELGDGTVTVPAGARFAEVAELLHGHGRALPNLGSLPHISVAGACATGTHGSGSALRCIAAGAVGVTFVAADGSLVSLSSADPAFGGAVLALGALGVVVSVTLETVPAYTVRQDVWLDASLPLVLAALPAVFDAGYSVSLFSTLRGEVVDRVWIKSLDSVPVADGRQWGAVPASSPQHPDASQDPAAATAQLGRPGPWHERIPHFRADFRPSSGEEQQSEYLLPREHAADAIAALYAVGPTLAPALQVAEFRTVAADDLWLSPCDGRDTVALHVTWAPADELVRPAVAAVEAALAPFDPRAHWGKVFALPPETVRAAYPQLPDFQSLAARYDPDRVFGNAFLEQYVY